MKRFTLALAFAIVAICGATTSKSVSAQEILLEGPLAGAPAVRKIVQYRELRFSVGPQFAYTILNPYMHNFLVGLRLEFNFLDWLGAGIVGYYAFNTPTKLTDHVTNSQNLGGSPTTPTQTASNWPSYTGASNFEDQVAKLKGQYLAQISFIPFRGKMSMFEKLFVAIDGSIFVGGGIVHYEERTACSAVVVPDIDNGNGCGQFYGSGGFQETGNVALLAPQMKSQIGGAFTWGIGFMAYFNDWFAVNLEYRMTPFKWNEAGTDEAGQAASTWNYENDSGEPAWDVAAQGTGDYPDGKIGEADRIWNTNQSVALGFIFYLPTKPSIGE
ncbi:MAG: hypothetical protein GY854_32265 [Deltaproteobacteria bacterium]|nr:hypothetical protein [Deltaproteobacteria bacterium]